MTTPPVYFMHATRAGKRFYSLSQIVAFVADNKYVEAITDTGERILLTFTLKDLMGKYGDEYVQCHRSTLIRKSAITLLKRQAIGIYAVSTKCGFSSPVSRRLVPKTRDAFRKAIAAEQPKISYEYSVWRDFDNVRQLALDMDRDLYGIYASRQQAEKAVTEHVPDPSKRTYSLRIEAHPVVQLTQPTSPC